MPLFACEQLCFTYPGGEAPVLHQASFAFEPMQRVGFHGPNGCGKSTFFYLLTGLLQPTSGHILFHDAVIRREREFRALRREVGLVLQNAEDQLFHPTVLEDVAFGPLNLGLSPAAARIRAQETLEALGLSGLGSRLIHRLSGGEKRLIALASVLSMRPRVLLLDEPTNDLDPHHRERLLQILQGLDSGWIIISHDTDFLQQSCTRFMGIENYTLVVRQDVVAARPDRFMADPLVRRD